MEKSDIMAKDVYIGFRTTAEIRKTLQEMANEGFRTLSQQCEMVVIQWLKQHDQLPDKPKKKS